MTKKHFIALADALRPCFNSGNLPPEARLAIMLFCRSQNPRFNSDRWHDYLRGLCGPSGGKVKRPAKVRRGII